MTFYTISDSVDPETGYDTKSGKYLPRYITQVSSFDKRPILYNRNQFTKLGLNVNAYIKQVQVATKSYSNLVQEIILSTATTATTTTTVGVNDDSNTNGNNVHVTTDASSSSSTTTTTTTPTTTTTQNINEAAKAKAEVVAVVPNASPPFLVLIDTEGYDCNIVMGISKDSMYWPKYLIFESHQCRNRRKNNKKGGGGGTVSYSREETEDYLRSIGYTIARGGQNTLGVRKYVQRKKNQ